MILNRLRKIFQSKTTKRICCVFVVLLIWYLCFSVWSDCFADGDISSLTQTKMQNFSSIVSELLKWIYVLLRPLLYICGIALDNSLVYGSWLHLDASLWTLWNIMKNIANFALWVLVLISIVVNLFSLWKWKKFAPKETIKNTVIAWVLIQMSWFLVAAIIDVSTILTYAIWWLPMTVLKTNQDYTNRPVMWINAIAWYTQNWMKLNLYYSYWDHKISECEIIEWLSVSGQYIVGPKYAYMWDEYQHTGFYLDTWYCAVWSWPYRYNHVLSGSTNWIYPDIYNDFSTSTGAQLNTTYLNQLKTNYQNIQNVSWVIDACVLVPLDASKIPSTCTGYWALSYTWNDEFFTWQLADWWLLYTVDNLIESSKWYVGPLMTIYSSLLDIQSFVSISDGNYVEWFISCFCKLIFFLILIVPIFWLAIVLICRVWILWLVIAASPILILCWVFKDLIKLDKFLWGNLNLWSLIKLVFAPVIVTFAISMSLIFITAISSIKQDSLQSEEIMKEMWIEKKENTYSILWLVNIQLDSNIISSAQDDFVYFITLLLSCGIIRFLLMEAVKLCGNVWNKIGENLSKKAGSLVENIPIVPIPTGNKTSIAAIKKLPETLFNQKLMAPIREMNDRNFEQSFAWLSNNQDKYSDMTMVAMERVSELRSANPGITPQQIESQLTWMEKNALMNHYGVQNITQAITQSLNYYKSDDNEKVVKQWKLAESSKSFADAVMLTKSQLDVWLKNDPNWRNWASWVVWSAVQVLDWMYVVDFVPGTENSWSVEYELLARDDYERRHFGEPVNYATADDFATFKASLSDSQKQAFDNYQTKYKELSQKYKDLADKWEKSDEEKKNFEWFEKNLGSDNAFFNRLKNKYNKPSSSENWESGASAS